MTRHIPEHLAATDPDCEIWWESSPLVHANRKHQVRATTPPEKRAPRGVRLTCLFDPDTAVPSGL